MLENRPRLRWAVPAVVGMSATLADIATADVITRYTPFVYDTAVPETLVLDGTIGQEAPEMLERALKAFPDISQLSLSSQGGFVYPALELGDKVHVAGLTTTIPSERTCLSACSFVFLAGVERAAEGKLGVHQIGGGNIDAAAAQWVLGDIFGAFQKWGVPPAMYRDMVSTLAESMRIYEPPEMRTLGLIGPAAMANTHPDDALPSQDQIKGGTIEYWHAFSGRLGELIGEQVDAFNAMQNRFHIVARYKGDYAETLNAGVAAVRTGAQPHILHVFDIGTPTILGVDGAIRPVHQVMADAGAAFDPEAYVAAIKSYYADVDGRMLSMPFNASTPVLWVNRDALRAAGVAGDADLSTWQAVGEVIDVLKSAGHDCPLTTAWQSWIHLKGVSAYHDVPFATLQNGFAGLGTELAFDGPLQVHHIETPGVWAQEGKFVYAGRRNEGGTRFRAGACALFTESSAGYAGMKAFADFDFEVHRFPFWKGDDGAPQNTNVGGASLWVMDGHSDEDYVGVATFLNFLSSPAIQAKWHQVTGYMPTTVAASDLTRGQGFYEINPGTDVAVTQMTARNPTVNSKGLRLGSHAQIRAIIDEQLEAVWAGEKSAQDALTSAVERGNALLRRFEQANRQGADPRDRAPSRGARGATLVRVPLAGGELANVCQGAPGQHSGGPARSGRRRARLGRRASDDVR